MVGARGPRKWRPTAVAAARIHDPPRGHHGVLQAELLTGKEKGCAALGEQDDRGGARPGFAAAMAGPVAGDVVVREHPGRPGADRVEELLDAGDSLAPCRVVPRGPGRGEVEGEVQLVVVAVVGGHPLGAG